MTENDIIAEYIKINYPEMLNTPEYHVFELIYGVANATKQIMAPIIEVGKQCVDYFLGLSEEINLKEIE